MKLTKDWLPEFSEQIQKQDFDNSKFVLRAKIEVILVDINGVTAIEKFEYKGEAKCGEELMAINKANRMLGDFEGGVV